MSSNYIHKENYNPKIDNPCDFFPTPQVLCNNAVKQLMPDYSLKRNSDIRVLDAGAGTGNWGRAVRSAWPTVDLVGVDLPENPYAEGLRTYNTWLGIDYRILTLDNFGGKLFDIIIGNPPYSTSQGKRDMHLAEKFVIKSMELLKPNGKLFFFLRTDFLAGAYRQKNFWPEYPPNNIYICAERVNFFPDRGTGQTHNHMIVEWIKSESKLSNQIIRFWSWK